MTYKGNGKEGGKRKRFMQSIVRRAISHMLCIDLVAIQTLVQGAIVALVKQDDGTRDVERVPGIGAV